MKKKELLDHMKKLDACNDAVEYVTKSKRRNADKIWNDCERGDWMLWLAARANVDRKLVVIAACACARESLRFVPADEDRPRIAIETAEAWCRGEATLDQVRTANAADAAAYADAYARKNSRAISADFVRGIISWDVVQSALEVKP